MPRKLNRVVVDGFKSIQHIDLEISDLNILIGPNGAGKSNFIGLFKFLKEIINKRLQVYTGKSGGANRILHYGSKITPNMRVALDFNPNYYEVNLIPTSNDTFLFESERCYFKTSSNKFYKENINNGGLESRLEDIVNERSYAGVPRYVLDTLQDWRLYHFHDTSSEAGVKKSGDIFDTLYLREDASNLAAFLSYLRIHEAAHYARIVKTIQLVVPYFKDFISRPNPFNDLTILLEWQHRDSDMVFNANNLSDGSLRFVCLATLLLQPKLPPLILLDEPELGLHPSAIVLLGSLIRKASKRSQVIVSTQSVNLVNEFGVENIIIVENSDTGSVFKPLDDRWLSSWLEDYTLGELWEQNILGGKP